MASSQPEPRWASVAEAAAHAKMSERTIRRWVHEGRLPAQRMGPRRIEIDLNELDKLRRPVGHEPEEDADEPEARSA
jgi:excisionase family DNA binding protein